ncbi:MAG TPA: hypothetical protein VGD33_04065, partial [Chitinophagaceae bacterium]
MLGIAFRIWILLIIQNVCYGQLNIPTIPIDNNKEKASIHKEISFFIDTTDAVTFLQISSGFYDERFNKYYEE